MKIRNLHNINQAEPLEERLRKGRVTYEIIEQLQRSISESDADEMPAESSTNSMMPVGDDYRAYTEGFDARN
jgi:hypothetical protein